MTKRLSNLILSGLVAGSMLVSSSVMAQPAPSKTPLTTTPTSIRQGLTENHAVTIPETKPAEATPVKQTEIHKKGTKKTKKIGKKTGKKTTHKKVKTKQTDDTTSGK